MASKRIIILLGVILLGMVTLSLVRSRLTGPLFKAKQNQAPDSKIKEEPTNTFVDKLIGDVLYLKDGGLQQVTLPSRLPKKLAGVSDEIVTSFPTIRPAWSGNGINLGLIPDQATLAIINFDKGSLVSKISLDPGLNLEHEIEVQFSPKGSYLFIREQIEPEKSIYRFFHVESGVMIHTMNDCSNNGFWIGGVDAFFSNCVFEGESVIVAITFKEGKAIITKVVGSEFTLINQFDSTSLLVTRKGSPGKLSLEGGFSSLDAKTLSDVKAVEAFTDIAQALANEIETLKNTEEIDDLVIAPTGTYAIYHTNKGLWIIDLPLQSDPFLLVEGGQLPSIRPL